MPWILALALAMAAHVASAQPAPSADDCLTCHAEPIDIALADGTTRTLRVHGDDLMTSVHATKATCVDCHPDAKDIPHAERTFASTRQFTVAQSEQCRSCHFSDYRRTLDSVHADAVGRGDLTAPVCVDCHGSHTMQKPNTPRTRVAETCARCHGGVAATYAKSVHGQDVAKNMTDVPTCVDCHRSHDIGGPKQAGWRTSTPDICGRCHADAARMQKYGLSTDVLKTYVADFHGKTASLQHKSSDGPKPDAKFVAVCSDCHGTHDVTRADAESSPVLKANLAKTCRKCHQNASDSFPDSWLSHYEPSWSRTPAVYGVKMAYSLFIPFIIGGLVLQMLLHIWRMAVNR